MPLASYYSPKDHLGPGALRNCPCGWVPDAPDRRDLWLAPSPKLLRAPPRQTDLRAHCPPVYHQRTLNSCTAQAIAAAIEFDKIKYSRRERFRPSRLFIYYNERALERTIASDSGAQIRSGMKTVAKYGVCREPGWPYRIRQFRNRPLRQCFSDAKHHPAVVYKRVRRSLPALKACLASGHPFVFGFTVYESLHAPEVTRTGRGEMPLKHDRIRAGHAVLAVGYDDSEARFLLRNSWGRKWGIEGYFTLPYDYLLNRHLSQDFWTLRIVA